MENFKDQNQETPEQIHLSASELAQKLLDTTHLLDHAHSQIKQFTTTQYEQHLIERFTSEFEFLLEKHAYKDLLSFIEKMSTSESFLVELQATPGLLSNLSTLYKNQEVFSDNEKLLNLIYNLNLYQQEKMDNDKEAKQRIETNPFADPEELEAGVYRENIESQVREAVFTFRAKGYNTFESGFGNRIKGEQFIGFRKDTITEKPVFPENLLEKLTENGVRIQIKELIDRYQLILTPIKNFLSVEEWKHIWNIAAELMPVIGSPTTNNKEYRLRNEFAESQEKLRKGEDTYLGNGMKFENGKVIPGYMK